MSVHTSTHVAVAFCRAWKTTLWMPLPASLAFTVMPTTPLAFGGGKLWSSDVGSTWSTLRLTAIDAAFPAASVAVARSS